LSLSASAQQFCFIRIVVQQHEQQQQHQLICYRDQGFHSYRTFQSNQPRPQLLSHCRYLHRTQFRTGPLHLRPYARQVRPMVLPIGTLVAMQQEKY